MKKLLQILCVFLMVFSTCFSQIKIHDVKAVADSGLLGTGISDNYLDTSDHTTFYIDMDDEEKYSFVTVNLLDPEGTMHKAYCSINDDGIYDGVFFDTDIMPGEWIVYSISMYDDDWNFIVIGNENIDDEFDYTWDFSHMSFVVKEDNEDLDLVSIEANKNILEVDDNIIFDIYTTQDDYIVQGTMYIVMANGHMIDLSCDIDEGSITALYNTFMTDPNGLWKVAGLEVYDCFGNNIFYVDEELSELFDGYDYELYDFSYLDFNVTMCNEWEGYYFYHDDMILSVDESRTTFAYNGLDIVEEGCYFGSKDESVAIVEEIETGVCTITGIADGETEIVLYNSDDEPLASCKVTVCYFSVDVYTGESAELELYTTSNSKIYADSQYDRFAVASVTDNGITISGTIYYNKLVTVYGKHYGTTCIELKNSYGRIMGNGRVKVNVIEKEELLEVMAYDSMIITLTTYHDEEFYYDSSYGDVSIETVSKNKSTYTTTINGESVSYDQYTYELELTFNNEGEEFVSLYGSESGLLQYIDIYAYSIETIELDKEELELKIGDTYELSYTTTPMNVSEQQLDWSSSNEDVVTVQNGKVVAVGAGQAVITLSTVYEGLDAKCYVTVKSDFPFTDVYDYDWYKGYVEEAYSLGLMTGASATLFKPKVSMNRGMVAIVLHRMEGEQPTEFERLFPDVKQGEYYAESVIWAKNNGVIKGYQDGTFRPLRLVTREEMAQMLYNFAKYKGVDVEVEADLSKFVDGNKVSSWHKDAMMWANANGLITGKDNGTRLDPQGTATRAECAKMLVETYKAIYR